MKIKSALVGIGGSGTRLNRKMEVPVCKSFLELKKKTIIYWYMLNLYKAGIEHVILAADDKRKLEVTENVINSLPNYFSKVILLQDQGFGTTNLLNEAKTFLDDIFLYEAGHVVTPIEHYRSLEDSHRKGCVVFSAYTPRSSETGEYVKVESGRIIQINTVNRVENEFDIRMMPGIFTLEYVSKLSEAGFNKHRIIEMYSSDNRLIIVPTQHPKKIDTYEEYLEVWPVYEKYVTDNLAGNGK